MESKRIGPVREPEPDDGDLDVGGPMSSGSDQALTSSLAAEPTSAFDLGDTPRTHSIVVLSEDPSAKASRSGTDVAVDASSIDATNIFLDTDVMTNTDAMKVSLGTDVTVMSTGIDVPMVPSGITSMTPMSGGERLSETVDTEILGREENLTALTLVREDSVTLPRRVGGLRSSLEDTEDPDDLRAEGRPLAESLFVDDESPDLPPGDAFASSSSCSSDSRVLSDEDVSLEVEQVRQAKKKAKAQVRPDPPGSSLSDEMSLKPLRKKCGISEEIVLVSPTPADRAFAPPEGYMTLFENYFDQCLLWFPLPRFLMRFLAVHGVCLAQINPRGIRHLLGIYLKYSVANSSGMALIAGFPSKDDHFEYRFFFAEIPKMTIEADCIDLVKTRWKRRVRPTLPKVSKEFLAAMYKELSSGNGQARLSLREQIALEAAAKGRGSSGTSVPRMVVPMTATPPAMRARSSRPSAPKTALPPPSLDDVVEFRRLSAERARISSGKGKGVDRVTPSERQRADAFPVAAVGGEASASGGYGLLRGEAYSVVKSRYSEDVRSRGSELSAAKEANAALQLRLDETVEQNEALGRDALALHKVKKDYEDKLSKLKSRCAKAEGEIVRLRDELSSASDLQRYRIDVAVAEARDEMTRSFVERTSEVAGLPAEIGGKVQNDMLNLTEIDANLEFIGLLQGSDPPDLPTEVETLRQRRHLIYDAHDVFADLLARVQRVLEIPTAPAGAVETSAAVDDDVELSDEDDVEATGDEGINPRGIRHLFGIYILSRECGVEISTENLSYLTDFRTRGLSEELKYSVANSTGMALIAGFPSKDDHFEYRFFFAEISEKTVEADCIDLVKTRWERRVRPTLPKVSKEFLAAMYKELSSGNGNWKRSFSRKRIRRAFSAEILPRK
ncbi:hypothetical protein AALP_AA2G058100, partial [Arabis alpina]